MGGRWSGTQNGSRAGRCDQRRRSAHLEKGQVRMDTRLHSIERAPTSSKLDKRSSITDTAPRGELDAALATITGEPTGAPGAVAVPASEPRMRTSDILRDILRNNPGVK